MSIQSEINRISGNVSDSLDAVAAKGVTVPQGANSDDLPTLIASIPEVQPATANPKMDGAVAVGTSTKYAREDHVHPTDTSRYSQPFYQNGTTDIGMRPLVAYARANRFAFLPPDQVIVEKTTDGGATWVSAEVSDANKKALFATRGSSIQIPLLNGKKNVNCGIRITFSAMKYNVPSNTAETAKYNYWNSNYINSTERYSNLRELWFWISSNNDAMRLQVYAATGKDPDNWVSIFSNNDFRLNGWSGSDWCRWSSGYTFGGGTNQLTNYWNWRIVLWSQYASGKNTFGSATPQTIAGINGYGDSVWSTPNGLMEEDHLYTWDADMNVVFPARITAGSFAGNLSGNATSATNAPTQASINSAGLITYKNASGTSLFTLQLPIYDGSVT